MAESGPSDAQGVAGRADTELLWLFPLPLESLFLESSRIRGSALPTKTCRKADQRLPVAALHQGQGPRWRGSRSQWQPLLCPPAPWPTHPSHTQPLSTGENTRELSRSHSHCQSPGQTIACRCLSRAPLQVRPEVPPQASPSPFGSPWHFVWVCHRQHLYRETWNGRYLGMQLITPPIIPPTAVHRLHHLMRIPVGTEQDKIYAVCNLWGLSAYTDSVFGFPSGELRLASLRFSAKGMRQGELCMNRSGSASTTSCLTLGAY